MNWKDAVLQAIERYSQQHQSVQIERQALLHEQLPWMVHITQSRGQTPDQTVSRVLQELRDEGVLFFSSAGLYVVQNQPLDASREDAADDVIANAIVQGNLRLGDVEVADSVGLTRQRKGTQALRLATLRNYHCRCALCDVQDEALLVASHIARWADEPSARGVLGNVLCLCTLHDGLFERGYFSLRDDYSLIRREPLRSESLDLWLTRCTRAFAPPTVPPEPRFLAAHRTRVRLNT